MSATLSVSLVVYQPDLPVLRETLASLRTAAERARKRGLIEGTRLYLIDNGTPEEGALDALARLETAGAPWLDLQILRGHGNVGYGRGHNLAIHSSAATYHIVLNPDVVVGPDAVIEAIRFLESNVEVGLVAPDVHGTSGERQYLCREYPTVLVLLLRGFAPAAIRRAFRGYMESHEMRRTIGDATVKGITIASGCFMFTRLEVLQEVGGFSPDYFLYFEDFDLSLRFGRKAPLAFVPAVRIEHHGGGAARKGARHTLFFIRSAVTFFRTHGWKLA
ncbi:MAG: glycosyltransferase [Gemmatimonadales bacterium]